jgi:hypothetical protein
VSRTAHWWGSWFPANRLWPCRFVSEWLTRARSHFLHQNQINLYFQSRRVADYKGTLE